MKKYDKKDSNHSRSLWPVLITLGIIFILLLGAIFLLKYKGDFLTGHYSLNKVSLDDTLKKQLDSQKGETAVQVRLTDEDVNKLLKTDAPDFPLKSPSVKITAEKIILSGKTGDGPLSLKVEVGIIPQVESGKVNFQIGEIKAAGVSAPKLVADSVNSKLSNYLEQYSPDDNITVTDIKMYDGYMTISGERK